MGKNLKGDELGTGLRQEKDGRYSARYTDVDGRRRHRRFRDLDEAKIWLLKNGGLRGEYAILHGSMTADEWFRILYKQRENMIQPSTMISNEVAYRRYIYPKIGKMKMRDIKPFHCQLIFNAMSELNKSKSTMHVTRSFLSVFFNTAVDNEIIEESPLKRSVKSVSRTPKKERTALTLEEQRKLLSIIEGEKYEYVYRFLLQTGLRSGELMALTWDDIDFEKKELSITKSLSYKNPENYILGSPKSNAGIRKIPLTDEAISILKMQKERNKNYRVRPAKEWENQVFIGNRGYPINTTTYSNRLTTLSKRNDLRPISVHILRHTFATRCIEAGMKPKILQAILGHENLSMTMNMYVHVTEDEKSREMNSISNYLLV